MLSVIIQIIAKASIASIASIAKNVVEELKLEIVKIGHNMKEDNIQKIQKMEILDRDIKALRYDINMLTKNIKSTELLVNQLNEKRDFEDS